ncbi:hypothetical protein [Sodalis-like endosymbiont of Proechinophthirus fluctus]|nr:hypothetical protein [Sodalis-like endosymbiont of Proechinophthirus fluctus]
MLDKFSREDIIKAMTMTRQMAALEVSGHVMLEDAA